MTRPLALALLLLAGCSIPDNDRRLACEAFCRPTAVSDFLAVRSVAVNYARCVCGYLSDGGR